MLLDSNGLVAWIKNYISSMPIRSISLTCRITLGITNIKNAITLSGGITEKVSNNCISLSAFAWVGISNITSLCAWIGPTSHFYLDIDMQEITHYTLLQIRLESKQREDDILNHVTGNVPPHSSIATFTLAIIGFVPRITVLSAFVLVPVHTPRTCIYLS
jgi:hypothetical protein